MSRSPPENFTVAVVSLGGRFSNEWPAMSWQQAVTLARQAKREWPSRLVFAGDAKHVWRITDDGLE